MPPIAGELVTESLTYDEGRKVTVYVPPNPAVAVVFAADGGWHVARLCKALEGGNAPPTMIVGIHGPSDDEGRLHEYVPTVDEDRFAAHEGFFLDDVGGWVRSRFGGHAASRAHCDVGRVARRRVSARAGTSPSGRIRRGLLGVAGADVVMMEREGGHRDALWGDEFRSWWRRHSDGE